MLIIIVRVIVVPTTRYHSTVKSVNCPAKTGNSSGSWTSLTLALTIKITTPYHRSKVEESSYSVNELKNEHFDDTRGFLFCFSMELLEFREYYGKLKRVNVHIRTSVMITLSMVMSIAVE